uniref:Cytochrome P450 71A9 n=1 Tax=Aegilops tauschii TaxID=37682 RepID=M8CTL6_AEGTA
MPPRRPRHPPPPHLVASNKIVRRVAFGGDDGGEGGAEASAVLKETQRLLGAFWVADYVPWLGWLDAPRGLRGRLERNFHQLDAFYESVIDSHLKRRASSSADDEEDLVDVLLRLHADPAHRSTFSSRDQIKGILTDMFIAGTDTSAATVEWTMTELVNHPDILAKAQHEGRSVVGDNGMVREPDLPELTYLKLTTEPCTVHGCEIPAGTRVLVNAKAIGAHAGAWGADAAQFVPERHEHGEDLGDFKPWHDSFALVPFGIGRRSCPGVHFATAVVELVLANLLFSFDWSAPLGEVDAEEENGLTIPAGTRVLVNAKAIGAHAGAWGADAAQFVPERHEHGEDLGDFKPWHDSFALVPFGIGRRSCPGVHFATAVVELVLANLLFSFDWSAPLGEVDAEEENGLTVYRKNPLMLFAKPRRCA